MTSSREVVLVAFEGPDRYSFVGGLATRVNDLADALVTGGHGVRQVFVGDPGLPSSERLRGGRLLLERWSQWVSAYHPGGVYDGEDGKRLDLALSLPPHVLNEVIAPAARRGQHVTILFEDWQTADAAIGTHRLLTASGLRDAASLFWNANNTYGLAAMDLPALARAATITTVSRYMRSELLRLAAADPQILPNGIAERFLEPLAAAGPARLRAAFGARPTFVKVARFDPDKQWLWALDALASLRDEGHQPRLVMRGSRSPYAATVEERIRARGLSVDRLRLGADATLDEVAGAIAGGGADIALLDFFVAEQVLRALYTAADGVLANSEHEPFGLVGLEVMASGGIAFVGRTGEDYAVPYGNAVVMQTGDPRELGAHLAALRSDPALAERIREEGRATAKRFSWRSVLPAYEAAWDAARDLRR